MWAYRMIQRAFAYAVLTVVAVGLATSCSKPKTAERSNSASPGPSVKAASSPASLDDFACTLLTREETQAVQGEAFKSTKPSNAAGGGSISQCYFELPTTVNSIVLTVTRKVESGIDPSESWRNIFHAQASAGKGEKGEEGEEKKPLKVDGIGDEAFWTGTRVGGALYVLKGNCYIRISVGGAGDWTQKIEKSKALAEKVLKRL
jgi:hypothetical protein